MGIAKFYRYIAERYPLINQQVITDGTMMPEFDNLYLDMNGMLHQCSHPNDDEQLSQSLSTEDIVIGLFNYIDRVVRMVRPRRLLYMAIDGVAPRAKMNQQRSRRFRAALTQQRKIEEKREQGEPVEMDSQFDSNCITPGTAFMTQIDRYIKYFVRKKMKEDPLWQGITVIYSSHAVPGEGEHKIMNFIRAAKEEPDYPPNLRHCMYGLDADLVMLSLATHEPHFALLREEVDFTAFRKGANDTKTVTKQTQQKNWQLLHISLFREYLELEMAGVDVPFYDLERVIDDFVFLIMLCGNDFVPHAPSLSIAEGAIDSLLQAYRRLLPEMGGYILDCGRLNLARCQLLFQELARDEDAVFLDRTNQTRRTIERFRSNKRTFLTEEQVQDMEADLARQQELATQLGAADSFQNRYYLDKFGLMPGRGADDATRREVTRRYVQGLQWVAEYYYRGCASWTWFYPFHYAPMLSDLVDLPSLDISYERGQPFRPFQQLLACLPPFSAQSSLVGLPHCYVHLMSDPESPLRDFYPTDFRIDMNGARNPWEGVNLLPFIDERRLMDAERVHCGLEKQSAGHRARNVHDVPRIIRYDPGVADTIASPLPGLLPAVPLCRTRCTLGRDPVIPADFTPKLCAGVRQPFPGFPTLHALPFSSYLDAIQVNLFGFKSRNATRVINISAEREGNALSGDTLSRAHSNSLVAQLGAEQQRADALASELLGATVFVKYPFAPKEALVVSVSDPMVEIKCTAQLTDDSGLLDQPPPRPAPSRRNVHTPTAKQQWQKLAEQSRDAHLRCARQVLGLGGLEIGTVRAMVTVRPLIGMRRDRSSGALRQRFSKQRITVPLQLCMLHPIARDPRFVPAPPLDTASHFPVGCDVLYVGDGEVEERPLRGCVGRVLPKLPASDGGGAAGQQQQQQQHLLDVEVLVPQPEPAGFGAALASAFEEKHMSLRDVSRLTSISTRVLGMVVGSVQVDVGARDKVDLGLNLRVHRTLYLPGYARPVHRSGEGRVHDVDDSVWTSGERTLEAIGVSGSPLEDSSSGDDGELPVPVLGENADLAREAGDRRVGGRDNVRGGAGRGGRSSGSGRGGGGGDGGGNSDDVQWEFTERAVALVAAYKREFPALMRELERMADTRRLSKWKLFGNRGADEEEVDAKLDEVCTWLQQLGTHRLPLAPLSSEHMSPLAVSKMEEAVALLSRHNTHWRRVKLRGVPPQCLARRYVDQWAPPLTTEGSVPQLGDRVANVSNETVPFGLRGSVVAVHAATACVDVAFDKAFAGGTSLNRICTPGHGRLVRFAELYSLTQPPAIPHHQRPSVAAIRDAAPPRHSRLQRSMAEALDASPDAPSASPSPPAAGEEEDDEEGGVDVDDVDLTAEPVDVLTALQEQARPAAEVPTPRADANGGGVVRTNELTAEGIADRVLAAAANVGAQPSSKGQKKKQKKKKQKQQKHEEGAGGAAAAAAEAAESGSQPPVRLLQRPPASAPEQPAAGAAAEPSGQGGNEAGNAILAMLGNVSQRRQQERQQQQQQQQQQQKQQPAPKPKQQPKKKKKKPQQPKPNPQKQPKQQQQQQTSASAGAASSPSAAEGEDELSKFFEGLTANAAPAAAAGASAPTAASGSGNGGGMDAFAMWFQLDSGAGVDAGASAAAGGGGTAQGDGAGSEVESVNPSVEFAGPPATPSAGDVAAHNEYLRKLAMQQQAYEQQRRHQMMMYYQQPHVQQQMRQAQHQQELMRQQMARQPYPVPPHAAYPPAAAGVAAPPGHAAPAPARASLVPSQVRRAPVRDPESNS